MDHWCHHRHQVRCERVKCVAQGTFRIISWELLNSKFIAWRRPTRIIMNYCGALCILRFQLDKKKKKRKEKKKKETLEDLVLRISRYWSEGGRKKVKVQAMTRKKKKKEEPFSSCCTSFHVVQRWALLTLTWFVHRRECGREGTSSYCIGLYTHSSSFSLFFACCLQSAYRKAKSVRAIRDPPSFLGIFSFPSSDCWCVSSLLPDSIV